TCFFGLSAFSAPPWPESAVADEGCVESYSFLFSLFSFLFPLSSFPFSLFSFLFSLYFLFVSAVSLILFSVLSLCSLCLAGVQRHDQMTPLPALAEGRQRVPRPAMLLGSSRI